MTTVPNSAAYDQAGNITSDGVNSYTIDGESRACSYYTSVLNENWTNVYDAGNHRVAKGEVPGGLGCFTGTGFNPNETDVLGQSGEQFSTLTPSGWQSTNVYANGQLLATYEGNQVYFALNDWLGTKRVVATGTGQVADTYHSLWFGDALAPSSGGPSDHHYTGQLRDPQSGLDYFGARFYASNMGRFLSPDYQDHADALPFVGIDPIPYVDPSNPQSFNLYSYVGNNLVSRTNSDGHDVNVCTTDPGGSQHCLLVRNEQYQAASQGNGSLNVPSLNQVGMNGNGSGQFYATNITDSSDKTVGTATYVSNGGADYYANRTGIDFLNTQTAPVVNTIAGITIGGVGVMMGAEVAPVVGEASAALRYQAALRAWKSLSAATGAAKLMGEFFRTGNVPPGLTPEMMKAYLDLAKTYLAAGMGTAGGIMQSGVGTQANRIQQLENYLGR